MHSEEIRMILGIDFGTCYSTAAIMNGLIPVTTFMKNDTTGMGIPSLFMYSEEDNMEKFGEDCVTGQAFRHPNDVVRYMKRTVRESSDNLSKYVVSGGKEYTIQQIIEKYLAYLISEVKSAAIRSGEYKNTNIEAVTITVPVGISSGQMMASDYNRFIRDTVMKITGLGEDRVRVLQEPVAAAISYLYSEDIRTHYDENTTAVVFDLGGGTLDITVVEHNPKTMEYTIMAKEGDLQLGGNDWDLKLREAILEKLGIEWSGSDEESQLFDKAVTELKMKLSASEESIIFFTMNDEDKFVKISREEFEGCTSELLDRAMEVLTKAIESDTLPESFHPDRIVLVGGSSNMPQIYNAIVDMDIVDKDNVMLFEPSKAIAKGAAVHAKMNFSNDGCAKGPKVIDMATLTYGFDSCYNSERDCIYNMIYKGEKFDENGMIVRTSDTCFVPLRDDQTTVSFEIYESEAVKGEGFEENWYDYDDDMNFNGLRVTVQVPPEFLGKATAFRMWVTITLDENGILTITILDRMGNKLAYGSSDFRA